MWKWFKWLLLGLIIIILAALSILYWYYYDYLKMDGKTLASANAALANGITVSDAKDDFVIMGSNKEEQNAKDNPSPYRLDYLDIKSVSLGADNNYIYYKMTFYNTIPKQAEKVNGDAIVAIAAKAEVVDNDGKEYGGFESSFGYVPVFGIPALNTYYFYGPTGIEWPESARYTGQGKDSKVYGGGGYDYIMGAFPYKKLGIKYGETINIRFPMEVGSRKYTHAAVDVLGGVGKSPALITWTIGSKNYSINNSIK